MSASMIPIITTSLPPISLDELKTFHSIDRRLYTRLVNNLHRNHTQSMFVIALWIWLEEMGYPNAVMKMLTLSDEAVNALAEEAVACLNCISSAAPPLATSNSDIPLTLDLMNKDISLRFFYANRVGAVGKITKIVSDVCKKAFEDIAQRAMVAPLQTAGVHSHRGTEIIMGEGSSSHPNHKQDERTLFLTFSRGYPLTEWEVREFLFRTYGDCVESIYMQEVPPYVQALFGRVVLRSASMIPVILDDKDAAKFVINGKHVRARVYAAKPPGGAAN